MPDQRDHLHDWAGRHDDEWITEHPLEVGILVGAIALAAAGWWFWGHEQHLILWVRVHWLPIAVVSLVVLGAAADIAWTITHRQKHGKIEKDWPAIAKGMGLDGVKLLAHPKDKNGETLKLALNRFDGKSATDVVNKAGAIAVAARAHPGRVRVIPHPTRSDLVDVRIDKRDPLEQTIPWAGSTMRSCTDPMVLGIFWDTHRVSIEWNERHILIGGVTGSGKSGIVNAALGNLAVCPDLAIWGIDLKGGMELGPWRDALDRLAVTPAEALTLLKDANAELDRRALRYGSSGVRKHTPTRDNPRLLVVVDELSQVKDEALSMVLRIANMGRAPGVQLLLATQHPSARQLATKDSSGTDLRGQILTRICMGVTESREIDMILGDGHRREGFWIDRKQTKPGTFLIENPPEHVQPRPARAFYMTDEDVAKAVETANLARLNAWTESNGESKPESKIETEAIDPILRAVEEAGEAGVKVETLVSELGVPKSTAHYRLGKMKEAGVVTNRPGGFWVRVQPVQREARD